MERIIEELELKNKFVSSFTLQVTNAQNMMILNLNAVEKNKNKKIDSFRLQGEINFANIFIKSPGGLNTFNI